MQKRKLKRAKHTDETKHIQRTLMNRQKSTLKDYPENKDTRLDENAKCRKQRRKSLTLRLYKDHARERESVLS